ncbi:MAG: hypothetical protein JW807_10850 [Spirochaetes bacterium]|nr:hypothetical protein [Spirochaetota bacterium]
MGTIIKSSSIYMNGSTGSIGLAVRAAEDCIEKAGVDRHDISLIIYSGIYRDDNIVEPAIAPLIQKRLGINLDPVEQGSFDRLTFSFDVHNGPCGFLAASRVAQSSLMSGACRYALLVSADAHPSKRHNPDFPFSNVGSAVMLGYSEEPQRGFLEFHFRTSGNGRVGYVAKAEVKRFGTAGRECIAFEVEHDYHDELLEFTLDSVREFINSQNLDPADVDLLLTSQQFKSFGKLISSSIGMNGKSKVIDLFDEYGDPHTSSLGLGYNYAASNKLLKKDDRILFVASGAGLSSACALYVA